MGKQDIIQVLTPDHSREATFLDEDATVGDLLTAMAIDSEIYSDGHWAFVEVAMPRSSTLTYRELFALDQGALSFDTPIKEIQERHQELLKNPDATVLKIVNLQYTLPVVFRHVPTVPEAHCRQIHILPSMDVRQIRDIVMHEMGLKSLDTTPPANASSGGAARMPTSADFVLSQVKVNADGAEEERQLGDDENPFELLQENRELLLRHQIKDYHFLFTVPDSWISKVESVTSRITKGWTATRPLSMAVYGLFGGAPSSPPQATASREISAPIPIASTSIHHPSFNNMGGINDQEQDVNNRKAQNRRQSMIAGSRLSSFFDPSSIGGWLAPDPKKRFSMIGGVSSPSLISRPTGFDNSTGSGSEFHNMSDEELNETFVALLSDLNIKDTGAMMQFSREKRIALIVQNQQLQQQKEQKERIASPDPYSAQGSNATAPRNAISRNKFIGSISSRVSFIEPDSPSPQPSTAAGGPQKLHSRYSSWSSLAGSYDGSVTETSGSPPKPTTLSERPMSPTMAAAGSLWSSWFGATQQNDTSSLDEPNDDSPQYYVDQLMNKTTTQKTLVKQLQALRVALATAKLSWIRQFLDCRGFRALETVLDRTTIKKRAGKANDLDETLQSECVQCLRVLMNTEPGFAQVLRSPSLVAHISYCLYTTNSKLRTKVAEVLAALCVMSPESHRLVLMALSDFRVAHEERFRFEYLVQTLGAATTSEQEAGGADNQENFEWEYKTACLSLMNALANSPSLLADRISLRNELRRRGLEEVFKNLQAQSPPESLLIQINVYEDEQHEDWVDLQEQRAYETSLMQPGEEVAQESELAMTISSLGPVDDELYPRIVKALQQYANAAVSTLTQEESDDEEVHDSDLISRQSPQFKEDLWTIVEKFGERVFQMRNLDKDWAICQDEFLEGIQHIVGKRGAILSFSMDPNLSSANGGANSNSSSAASVSSLSLMSSRRHSYIDYEIDSLRHDVDDLRDDNDKLRKDLELARSEAEEARVQLQIQLQQQQQKELEQQQQKSKSGHFKDPRDGSDSELPTSYGKRENHAGVVQRLVQKEKEVAQLRETIEKMEKKYKDKAELVTDDEPRKSERSKEIDSTRWNAMMSEVQIQKNKTAEVASLADERQKEIAYLKRALEIVCTRYENAMGERPPAVTDDDHANQQNQTEGALQLSKTFEALARKDEEIIELKDEVERLRKETMVGLTPTEEALSLRGSLKDVMQRVQELQIIVAEREKTIKGLKESLFSMEAAKLSDDKDGVSQAHGHHGQPAQPQQQATNGRVDKSHSRGNLKLQIKALSANGWQAEEADEDQEETSSQGSALSPSTSDSQIQNLGLTSPGRQRPSGGVFSPILSPQPGKTRVLGSGGRRPALPPPPPPPGPKHQIYAANAAAAALAAAGTAATAHVAEAPNASTPSPSGPPSPPPPPPTATAAATQVTQVTASSSAPPPPPPPPPFTAARSPQQFSSPSVQVETTVVPTNPVSAPPMNSGAPPPPPPPPPPPFIPAPPPGPGKNVVHFSTPAPPAPAHVHSVVATPVAALVLAAASSSPPPLPPIPPGVGFSKEALKVPSYPLSPPPPPPPPSGPIPAGAHGAASLEGAIPTLPVFLAGNRTANPLKPLAMAIPQVVKPTRPMKQLFWNKLPTGTITQTVWKDICDPSSDLGSVDLDYAEIDELFCKNQTIAANPTASAEKKKTSLFSVNRANNIAIMLSRIKLTYPDIRVALMEILDEKLSIENLKAIKQYVPSGDEIELIREYDGDFESLGNAEKFYREIMDIPRLSERVSAMIFRRRLEIEVGELKPEMDVLRMTIEELHGSRRLRSLLKTVLLMGNHLNATSFRGNAYGFQLDALLKIRDTKGVDGIKPGSSTLLHYLAKAIQTKDPQLLQFLDEVPHLEAAARISVATLMSSVNSLVAGMNHIREEIRVLRRIRISPPNDHFVDVMEKFADANEEGIQRIVEIGQGVEQDLRQLLTFYGEDPVVTKPEDFFGMLVSFSTQLQKSQKENEALEKRLKSQAASKNNANNLRRPSDTVSSTNTQGLSVAAIRDGHLDDAIRGLRSGLRRNRRDRPMSHLYSELSIEALQAINTSVPRAGALTHSRQSSRQQ